PAIRPDAAAVPSPRRSNSARWDQVAPRAHTRGQLTEHLPWPRPHLQPRDTGQHLLYMPAVSEYARGLAYIPRPLCTQALNHIRWRNSPDQSRTQRGVAESLRDSSSCAGSICQAHGWPQNFLAIELPPLVILPPTHPPAKLPMRHPPDS